MNRRLAAAAILAAVLLAGCSGTPAKGADGPEGGAPGASVTGVVVDPAIRPLAGASVTIPLRPEAGAQVTGADGLFTFQGLAPGVVVLQVAKAGYLTASVQAEALERDGSVVNVALEPLAETAPYVVHESFSGLLTCGVGAAPVFGFAASCTGTAGSGLVILCDGSGPVPPTGVCVGEGDPYHRPQAAGNLTMVQTELAWDPSVGGFSQLSLTLYVLDPGGFILAGAGGAAGASPLVVRLDKANVTANALDAGNRIGIYVGPASGDTVNVAAQQQYQAFHTTAYHFLLEPGWTFVADGEAQVPPSCTVC